MKLVKSSIRFYKIIFRLFFSHSFLTITLVGNLIIMGFSSIFYLIEQGSNPAINSYLDAVWWGFSTATTVGYGDIIPLSPPGKILGIVLMLTGTALFATYTALFAQTILEDEFMRLKFRSEDDNTDEFIKSLHAHKKLIDRQIKQYEKQKDDD